MSLNFLSVALENTFKIKNLNEQKLKFKLLLSFLQKTPQRGLLNDIDTWCDNLDSKQKKIAYSCLKSLYLKLWNKNISKTDYALIKKYFPYCSQKEQSTLLEISKSNTNLHNELLTYGVKEIPELTQALKDYQIGQFDALNSYLLKQHYISQTERDRIVNIIEQYNSSFNSIDYKILMYNKLKKKPIFYFKSTDFYIKPNELEKFWEDYKTNYLKFNFKNSGSTLQFFTNRSFLEILSVDDSLELNLTLKNLYINTQSLLFHLSVSIEHGYQENMLANFNYMIKQSPFFINSAKKHGIELGNNPLIALDNYVKNYDDVYKDKLSSLLEFNLSIEDGETPIKIARAFLLNHKLNDTIAKENKNIKPKVKI